MIGALQFKYIFQQIHVLDLHKIKLEHVYIIFKDTDMTFQIIT